MERFTEVQMRQFYKAQIHRDAASRYMDVLAMSDDKRAEIAGMAAAGVERYRNGGSNQREFKDNMSAIVLYSLTDSQLRDRISACEALEREALEEELTRCRDWIISAFDTIKRMRTWPKNDKNSALREKNIDAARSWVRRYWPEYKAARKMVKGF